MSPTFEVGASLELLQTYLLIHDDWMDEDNERRGGLSVHYAFQKRHGNEHLGASLGILAGDLASTFGWEILLGTSFPAGRRDDGLALFVKIQKEVFAGQQLDHRFALGLEAPRARHHHQRLSQRMAVPGGALVISIELVAGVLSLLLGIYLLVALLRPERF